MSRWFRVYDGLVEDPKVQRLPAETFKGLINLWCLTSKNNGALPSDEDIAFSLRMKIDRVKKLVGDLRAAGLLDEDEDGRRPHKWSERQFKSDSSTTRVKEFRNRKRNGPGNVDETLHETPPDTETETDSSEAKASGAEAPPTGFEEDDRSRLFGAARHWLEKQTGQSTKQVRSLQGRWLKLVGDDATAVLEVIRRAKDLNVAEPVAWIEAALRGSTAPAVRRDDGVTDQYGNRIDWDARASFFAKSGMWLEEWGDPRRSIPAEHRSKFSKLMEAA